jgi:uroporphyrinogen decarboxylase
MTPRERVLTALEHHEPDRVPWDCTFCIDAYARLKRHLGQKDWEEVRPGGPFLNIRPPLELVRELQIDLYYVGLSQPKGNQVFEAGMDAFTDEWGVRFEKIRNRFGFAYEFADHPLAHATVEDLESYPWPDPCNTERTAGLAEKCRRLYERTDLALVGKFSTSIFEQAFYMRGMEQWLMDLAINPDFANALMGKLVDIALAMTEVGLRACGPYVQILRLAGDDLGQQNGMLVSEQMFRSLLKPHFARLFHGAKSMFLDYNPRGKLMTHTDGDVYPILSDFAEMGLDVLNPVQPYVKDMDHSRLKREIGDRLSFHGGIDIQHVLPFGSPADVRAEVQKAMSALGSRGGYIMAPTHYLQADVPPENILALRDAVLECGRYPRGDGKGGIE